MQALETFATNRQTQTLKLITVGRVTGLPHIAELRYANLDGSFFVLANSMRSDWALNALANKSCKARLGILLYDVNSSTTSSAQTILVLEAFQKKYGSRIIDQWYTNSQICMRLHPLGQPSVRGATRGEYEGKVSFPEWKNQGKNYPAAIQEAFDSASEEYDYTISHNYINSWIRKRSINELGKITRKDDVLLEIGCGTGAEAIRIAKNVERIIATDISEKMLDLVRRKVKAKGLERKIIPANARVSEISRVKQLLPTDGVRVAYSFNGALNCEPDIEKVPSQLATVIGENGYFLCSIRNTLCLTESLSHSLVLQFDKMATRKIQPTMVSVGGLDIPSYYYSPARFVSLFRPFFRARKVIGLPSFLPPAYLSKYVLQAGKSRFLLEKLELLLANRFPFNRVGDQTLFVFQRS